MRNSHEHQNLQKSKSTLMATCLCWSVLLKAIYGCTSSTFKIVTRSDAQVRSEPPRGCQHHSNRHQPALHISKPNYLLLPTFMRSPKQTSTPHLTSKSYFAARSDTSWAMIFTSQWIKNVHGLCREMCGKMCVRVYSTSLAASGLRRI